jgi:hypothetical protein
MKQSQFFEKIHKIDNPLAKLTKKKKQRDKTQLIKLEVEKIPLKSRGSLQIILKAYIQIKQKILKWTDS